MPAPSRSTAEDWTEHNRLRIRRLTALGLVSALGAGALLLRLVPASRFYPPCPIHLALGILCPGCGATRALAALLHGEFAAAWQANALLIGLLPLVLAYLATILRRLWLGRPDPFPRAPAPATCMLLILAFAFTLARNLGHSPGQT